MEFHFVKLIHYGTFLSLVDPSLKPRFICFTERDVTNKCIDYMAEFRNRNRIWPSFDMSGDRSKLKIGQQVKFPYGTPKIIKRSLQIESYDLGTIDLLARKTNISFYCILNFDVQFYDDTETISLSGQEMDGMASPEDFGEWMDFSLKIK